MPENFQNDEQKNELMDDNRDSSPILVTSVSASDFGLPHERFPRVFHDTESDTVITRAKRAGRAVITTYLYGRRGR